LILEIEQSENFLNLVRNSPNDILITISNVFDFRPNLRQSVIFSHNKKCSAYPPFADDRPYKFLLLKEKTSITAPEETNKIFQKAA